MKAKKILILLGLVVTALAVVLYSHSEAHFPIYPYIDTIFSKNFTWDKFNKIKIGMKKAEVVNQLGEPIRKVSSGVNNPSVCWEYSTDGKLEPYADFSWYSVKICFTQDSVLSKPINEFGD